MHNFYSIIFISYDIIPFLNLYHRVGHCGNVGDGSKLFQPRVLPEISHFDLRKLANTCRHFVLNEI